MIVTIDLLFWLLGELGLSLNSFLKSKSSFISKVSQINCICCFLHDKAMQIYPKKQKNDVFARIVKIMYSQLRIAGLVTSKNYVNYFRQP